MAGFDLRETRLQAAPIILDLDGRGVETQRAAQSSAMFDIDGNGIEARQRS
ncbi:hypothetical protein [Bradyrhizobium sp. OAE829]|uniref:hypothetical protein n=1 Tax=Bradyrhizobium sp. OAE829 TaxID=2663807 RepID=UPI00178ADAA0